jgi:hypothetical protein
METNMQNFQVSLKQLLKNVVKALRFAAGMLAYRAMIHLPPHEMRRLNNQLAARRRGAP